MIKLKQFIVESMGTILYPKNHKPGMRVPNGGSSCSTCKFWNTKLTQCSNKYYRLWSGTASIPENPDEYCSDWYEPK